MPHPHLGQFTQTEHVPKPEHILHFSLKFVSVGAHLQRQHSTVSILPKQDQKHVGISASPLNTRETTDKYVVTITATINSNISTKK